MFRSTPDAAAWLAGIIDGEGTVANRLYGTSHHRYIQIVNTDEQLLAGVHEACAMLGLTLRSYNRENRARLGRKPIWQINIGGRENVERLAEAVLPSMQSEKAQRFRDMLASFPEKPPIDRIVEMYESGLGSTEIANQLELPKSNVQFWLGTRGVTMRKVGRQAKAVPPPSELSEVYERLGTMAKVGEHYNVSPGTANKWLRAAGLSKPVGHKPERESRSNRL